MVHALLKEGTLTVGEDYNGVWSCNGLILDRRLWVRAGTICFDNTLLAMHYTTVMVVRPHLLFAPVARSGGENVECL